ncbi:MAG TPA: diaminopimelate epimerase [Phycisphaerales bacterium]|nr:diaminopimelate epimerase [Phycisphaerales bacterium]
MRFVKMHGIGNDYVVLDAIAEPALTTRAGDPALARALCDRRLGVGADGVIVLSTDRGADARMTIINADGSDGGMCGNGARCAAKFLVDRGHAVPDAEGCLMIRLGARVLRVAVELGAHGLVVGATVDMGAPIVDPARVPVDVGRLPPPARAGEARQFTVDDRRAVFVSMGNPHAVLFIDERVESVDIAREGARLERHGAFPDRMNVHFVNADSRAEVRMRSWERGVGETMGCGTGACAALVAGALCGRLGREVRVCMPGGALEVAWDRSSGHVLLSGPATEVFQGEWSGGNA